MVHLKKIIPLGARTVQRYPEVQIRKLLLVDERPVVRDPASAISQRAAKENLLTELRRILTHSLGSNLLPANREKDGPSWRVDWPLSALLLPVLLIESIALYALMDDAANRTLFRLLILMQAWGLGFVWIATWLSWNVKKAILQLVEDDLGSEISAESMERAAELLRREHSPSRRWPLVISATLLWCVLSGPAMAYDLGFFKGPADSVSWGIFWIWLFSFALTFAMAIKLGFTGTFYWNLVQGYRVDDLDSHPLTPAEAPVIWQTLRIGSQMLGFMVFTAVYLLTLAFWAKDLKWFLVVNLTICLLGSVGLGAAVYLRVYTRLTELIRGRRARTLKEIEERLAQLYTTSPGESPPELKGLLDLHGQVAGRSPGLGMSELLKMVGPLLPQLIAVAKAIRALSGGQE